MHPARIDVEFVSLDEHDANAAAGKDHFRQGPAFSFFLNSPLAQPATTSNTVGSRSGELALVPIAAGAQKTLDEARVRQVRWRFAASLIVTTLVVAGTYLYFRGEVAYEATLREAVEANAAPKLTQQRNQMPAGAPAEIPRDHDTTLARSSKTADSVAELTDAIDTKATELIQQPRQAAELPIRAPASAAPSPARKLDSDEIAIFKDRANRFIAAGDISPARLLLERAADALDSTAALMLGMTYDPNVLGTHGSRDIISDPAMARVWYERAAQLGSADAQHRLDRLQK
jgi:hypothetical protein